MASDQRFSLKWNNYQTHLVTAFESLLGESDFVDVTLGVEGRKLSAHKMLLSACSPYFRDLLKGNPCQHPIIVLRDIRYSDLYSLLQFMYNGEVNVAQDQLNSFLKSAESLKIRGLTDNEDSEVTKDIAASGSGAASSRKKRSATDVSSVQQPPLKRLSAAQPSHVKDVEPVKQEVIDINDQDEQYVDEPEVGYEEGGGGPPQAVDQYGEAYADGALAIPDDGTVDQHTDTQGHMKALYQYDGRRSRRSTPAAISRSIQNVSVAEFIGAKENDLMLQSYSETEEMFGYIPEEFHDETSLPEQEVLICKECGKAFRTKGGLTHHMEVHKGLTNCPVCGKIQSKVANLKRHLAQVHKVDMNLTPIV